MYTKLATVFNVLFVLCTVTHDAYVGDISVPKDPKEVAMMSPKILMARNCNSIALQQSNL